MECLWFRCVGVLLATSTCFVQTACQKDRTASVCRELEQGMIRFYGDPRDMDNRTLGQVLVCEEGLWRRICEESDSWTAEDAKVACRQLGFSGGETFPIEGQSWVVDLPDVSSTVPVCTGSESTLAECDAVPLDVNNTTSCDALAVGVQCSQPMTQENLIATTSSTSQSPSTVHRTTTSRGPVREASITSRAVSATHDTSAVIITQTGTPMPTTYQTGNTSKGADSVTDSTGFLAGVAGGGLLMVVITLFIIVTSLLCRKRMKSAAGKYSFPVDLDEEYVVMHPAATAKTVPQQDQRDTTSRSYVLDAEDVCQQVNPQHTAESPVYEAISGFRDQGKRRSQETVPNQPTGFHLYVETPHIYRPYMIAGQPVHQNIEESEML